LVAPDVAAAMATWGCPGGRGGYVFEPTGRDVETPGGPQKMKALAFRPRPLHCAAGSYGNRPEPMPFLHILAVDDREDVRGEHGPLT
jgi:hypothetical protein